MASTQTKARPGARPSLAEQKEYVRALWYGDPGKGKTTHAAALAKLGRVLYVNAEGGLKATALRRVGIPIENIEPITITDFAEMQTLGFEIQGRLEAGEQIAGVVWDSITEIYQRFIEQLVNKAVEKDVARGKDRDVWDVQLDDYGDAVQQVRRCIRQFRDLPCHWGVVALPKREQDEEGGVVYQPAVSKGLMNDLMGYTDLVINCRLQVTDGVEEYIGITRPEGKYEAKDRFGVTPRFMMEPSFPRIIAYVNGQLKATDDPLQQAAKQRRLAMEAVKTEGAKPDA